MRRYILLYLYPAECLGNGPARRLPVYRYAEKFPFSGIFGFQFNAQVLLGPGTGENGFINIVRDFPSFGKRPLELDRFGVVRKIADFELQGNRFVLFEGRPKNVTYRQVFYDSQHGCGIVDGGQFNCCHPICTDSRSGLL